MGFRISTGLGPVRFNAPIPMAVVAGVLGLCCCGAVVNAFNGDDDKPQAETAVTEPTRFIASPARTPSLSPTPSPRPTTAKPSPKRTTAKPVAKPSPTRKKTQAPTTDHRYGTCKEAISNGLGPYVKGEDPEYYWYRDTDSDGVTCER